MNRKRKTTPENIESGLYADSYLIYNRKSTDEANNQKNSISYQRNENLRFSMRENFNIAPISIKGFVTDGIISEKHSGFKEDDMLSFTEEGLVQYKIERPKFQKLLQLLNKGHFKGVICLCWDRISRNKGDDTIIRKLMRRGIDIQFVYAKYDKSSAGELHMDIDGMFSQHHSRVTSEKVTLSTKSNRKEGVCTYRAPIGYLNLGNMQEKPFDPERAPIVRELFELCAQGGWTLSDLARYANEQGLTTVPMRRRRTKEELLDETLEIGDIPKVSRPINENHVSRMMRNRFYLGYILDTDGLYVPSKSHMPLIDEKTFRAAQKALEKRTVSVHYTEKLDQPFRGMVRCGGCNRAYTPYEKKGIQYFGARCRKDCNNTQRSLNLKYLTNYISEKMNTLYFSNDEIIELDRRTEIGIALLEERRNRELVQIERKKKKVREDLSYLRSNKLNLLRTGAYSPEEYHTEEERLNSELYKLNEREQTSDEAMHETMKDIKKLSELLKDITQLYDFANPHEKEDITKCIFSELHIFNNTLKYKVQTGLECLVHRFDALCDPMAWLSELSSQRVEIISMCNKLRILTNA